MSPVLVSIKIYCPINWLEIKTISVLQSSFGNTRDSKWVVYTNVVYISRLQRIIFLLNFYQMNKQIATADKCNIVFFFKISPWQVRAFEIYGFCNQI